jgi:hypothetical protein
MVPRSGKHLPSAGPMFHGAIQIQSRIDPGIGWGNQEVLDIGGKVDILPLRAKRGS